MSGSPEEKVASGEWLQFRMEKGSPIWQRFSKLKTAEGEVLPLVMCDMCGKTLKFLKGSSPSNLKRHNCAKRKMPDDSGNSSNKKVCVAINEKIKKKVIDTCINLVTCDLRPFDTVAGDGFKTLASCLIDIGAEIKTTNYDLSDILPHPTTVSRNLKTAHESKLKELVEILEPKIANGECAATMDLWTESHTQKHFLTFTVHYIDESWNLNRRVLFTEFLPNFNADGNEQKKTAEYIVTVLQTKFEELGFSPDVIQKLRYTTDQGSNIKKALKNCERRNCTAHVLNNVLQATFEKKELEKSPKINELIHKSKSLVEYLKRSGKMQKLEKTVIQDCKTRWNTKYDMLLSLSENFDAIEQVLKEHESDRLIGIDKYLLNRMITILKPFKTATLILECDKKPTIHAVIFQITILQEKLNEMLVNESNAEITTIVKGCLRNITEKFVMDDCAKIAAFLWPEMKQLRYINEEERRSIQELVREKLTSISGNREATSNIETDSNSSQASSTSVTEDEFYFNKYRDVHAGGDMELNFEMEKYLNFSTSAADHGMLQWWRNHETTFPNLAKLARNVLCIPASSASSERCFSTAGRIMEERRANLKGVAE